MHALQGHVEGALACQRESLAIHQDLGDPHGQAESLRELGVTLWALGRHHPARTHWKQALALFEQLRSAAADGVRVLLADRPAQP